MNTSEYRNSFHVRVNENSTAQITLFPTAQGITVDKVLVYYGLPQSAHWGVVATPQLDRNLGSKSNRKVDVYIQFQNEEKNKLGIPLPAGKVRAYKRDQDDGGLEFIGEDVIDHTPKDEKVLIKIGQAFDVVGERTQTDFSVDTSGKTLTESFLIEIRNHKKTAEQVIIRENMFRWLNWKITDKSEDFEKIDARTVHFMVAVPASGKKTVRYTVQYSW